MIVFGGTKIIGVEGEQHVLESVSVTEIGGTIEIL